MLQQLELHEFMELAKTAKRVAVYREIPADRLTPIGIVENLAEEMADGAVLESGLTGVPPEGNSPYAMGVRKGENRDSPPSFRAIGSADAQDTDRKPLPLYSAGMAGIRHQDAGRFSFIMYDSLAQLSVKDNIVSQRIGSKTTHPAMPPLPALRQLLAELAHASKHPSVDFMNAAVGFIAYDAIRLFESIPDRHQHGNSLPEMLFNFYRNTLMFDHLQQKLVISVVVETESNPEQTYHSTQEKISAIVTKITASQTHTPTPVKNTRAAMPVVTDVSDEQFIELVEQAKKYIIAGDAFQIVLSRCFKQPYCVKPFDIYRALRRISPAPYMFYFPFEQSVIVGASPEKLISVRQRNVTINPIAGTRPRTQNSNDQQISDELLNDKKERAEHMMLVDLARNDLGAVCMPGTIKVQELMQVKHFSHVSHITSVVTGQLREDKDTFDALAATFPAGTLSGAPKIRAMEIIDELETSRRGIYGGAICRIDNQGNLDSCIAIRMAVLTAGEATIRTGAGIVYDSNPESEARETRYKAQSVLEAIRIAEEELV